MQGGLVPPERLNNHEKYPEQQGTGFLVHQGRATVMSVSCVFFVPLLQVWVPPSLIERLTGDAGLDSPAGQCQVRVPLSLIKRSTGDAEQDSPAGVKSNILKYSAQ